MIEKEKKDQTLVEYPDEWCVWRTATQVDYDFEQSVYQCLFVLFVIGYVIFQLISFIVSLIW